MSKRVGAALSGMSGRGKPLVSTPLMALSAQELTSSLARKPIALAGPKVAAPEEDFLDDFSVDSDSDSDTAGTLRGSKAKALEPVAVAESSAPAAPRAAADDATARPRAAAAPGGRAEAAPPPEPRPCDGGASRVAARASELAPTSPREEPQPPESVTDTLRMETQRETELVADGLPGGSTPPVDAGIEPLESHMDFVPQSQPIAQPSAAPGGTAQPQVLPGGETAPLSASVRDVAVAMEVEDQEGAVAAVEAPAGAPLAPMCAPPGGSGAGRAAPSGQRSLRSAGKAPNVQQAQQQPFALPAPGSAPPTQSAQAGPSELRQSASSGAALTDAEAQPAATALPTPSIDQMMLTAQRVHDDGRKQQVRAQLAINDALMLQSPILGQHIKMVAAQIAAEMSKMDAVLEALGEGIAAGATPPTESEVEDGEGDVLM